MRNGRSAKNLKELIVLSVILLIVGIIMGILNLAQNNYRFA